MLGYFSKVGGPHAGVLLKGRGPHAGVLLKGRGATCWGTSQRY